MTEPQHATDDGHLKGWSAAEIDPAEYTDDNYAAQFPEVSRGADPS